MFQERVAHENGSGVPRHRLGDESGGDGRSSGSKLFTTPTSTSAKRSGRRVGLALWSSTKTQNSDKKKGAKIT